MLYPRVGDDRNKNDRDKKRVAYTLFGLGTECREAIGKTLNLVDGFVNYRERYAPSPPSPLIANHSNYLVRGSLAYPATALESVRKTIEAEIQARPELANRQRVVVMIVSSESDEEDDNPAQKARNPKALDEVNTLRNISQLTLIAAGNAVRFTDPDQNERNRFHKFLNKLASGTENYTANAVMANDSFSLSIGIVNRMAAVEAICEEQSEWSSLSIHYS